MTINFDSWRAGHVAPVRQELTVVAPRTLALKLEPISPRLKGELIHPNRGATIGDIKFSPDGKRVIAGDYPGGVLAVWEVTSGNLLSTIDTGYGSRSSLKYFCVAPDWKTVYAAREKRSYQRVEQDGKPAIKWTFDGDFRAWRLPDGSLLRVHKHQPPRGIWWMTLAPDGRTLLTAEHLSGVSAAGYRSTLGLWDVKSGAPRSISELHAGPFAVFAPDGRSIAITSQDAEGNAHALKLIDADTGREKWVIPISGANASLYTRGFSPDGRVLFTTLGHMPRARKWDEMQISLQWVDAANGHQVASFECDKKDDFAHVEISPEGRTLAAVNMRSDKRKLYLFSVPEKRLRRTVILGEDTPELSLRATSCTFSPDGRWLAIVTRQVPKKRTADAIDPGDLPQPRILLVYVATGDIRETIIAPQGFSNNACFSPDGRTLASDGRGRVLLWDMTKLP